MKCPVCPATELLMTEREGAEIDYCPACRGVWLDRGELDVIVERSRGRSSDASGLHEERDTHGSGGKKKSSLFGDLLGGLGG